MRWKWLRVLLLAAALLVLLVVGGLWLLLQSVDRGAVMARAVQEVQSATGRDFAVEGPVHLSVYPSLALVAEEVRLGNAPWGTRPDMARIGQLRFDIALAPLMERRVEIGRIEVSGIDLLLETNAEGLGNWNFQRAASAEPEPSPQPRTASPIRVTLAQLEAQDIKLAWRSGQSGHTETVDVRALTLERHPDPARAPNAWHVALDGSWRAQKLHAEGGVGVQLDAQTGARSIPLDLDLRMEGATASIDGQVDLGEAAGQAQLKVEADIQSTQALAEMLRVKLPLPVPARFSGELALRPRQLQIDNLELETQGQTVAGSIVWDRGATPPALQLALRADSLDLARLFPVHRSGQGAPDAKGDARVFPDTPFPAIKPPGMAIQADLRAERLVLPNGLELGAVQLRGSSSAERIDIAQLDFGLARGRFNLVGGWQQGAGSAAPRVNAQIKARGVALDAVLALARRETAISGGRTELDARLSASGNSPRRLAASLNGEVRVRVGEASSAGRHSSGSVQGELVSALLHALTPLRGSDDSFKLRCAAARLPVKAGRIEIDRSIAIEGDRVDVVMSGLIDLAGERVDLGMRPTVKKGTGLDPTAFAGLVKIAGPLGKPEVQVNMAGTAREAVNIGAAVATGGATILGERLLGRVNDAHPCDSAYSGSAKTTAAPAAAAPSPSSKSGAAGGRLRNLFGR
ncbi:MAG: AsmA family protein [Proteobacteria bacterium]|nr:AsmA family protein [Pseudomonadota bacterium]